MIRRELTWRLGSSESPEQPPSEWIDAQVPGAVQLDWARKHGWPDPAMDNDPGRYRWMEDRWWWYVATPTLPEVSGSRRLRLWVGGIDYEYHLRVDGKTVVSGEEMFTPVEADLTHAAGRQCRIEILIAPAPLLEPQPGRQRFAECAKWLVSKGWDFHPRLVPLGIWPETYLALDDSPRLTEAETFYELTEDLSVAKLRAEVAADALAVFRWTLLGPDGGVVWSNSKSIRRRGRLSAALKAPRLWWPWDHGEQPLYTSRMELVGPDEEVLDQREQRIGFRRAPGDERGDRKAPAAVGVPQEPLRLADDAGNQWATHLRPGGQLRQPGHLSGPAQSGSLREADRPGPRGRAQPAALPGGPWCPPKTSTSCATRYKPADAGVMDVALELAGHSYEIGTWSFPPAKPNGHLRGEAMSIELPAVQTDLMRVHLLVLGRPEMDSTYTLAYRQAGDASTS